MKESTGNLWHFKADCHCITTNGFIKNNGEAVMGAGIAKEAKERWPHLPKLLGQKLKVHGNHTFYLGEFDGINLISLPVKHKWFEKADLWLIERSCKELTYIIGPEDTCVLPRPGCGNGKLNWRHEVKPVVERILTEDRFVVVSLA